MTELPLVIHPPPANVLVVTAPKPHWLAVVSSMMWMPHFPAPTAGSGVAVTAGTACALAAGGLGPSKPVARAAARAKTGSRASIGQSRFL